jgi:hypothetical protein
MVNEAGYSIPLWDGWFYEFCPFEQSRPSTVSAKIALPGSLWNSKCNLLRDAVSRHSVFPQDDGCQENFMTNKRCVPFLSHQLSLEVTGS